MKFRLTIDRHIEVCTDRREQVQDRVRVREMVRLALGLLSMDGGVGGDFNPTDRCNLPGSPLPPSTNIR